VTDRPVTLCLTGDVMLGRGIDCILPHPGDPRLHESHAASAEDYVRLAEARHGPIPRGAGFDYVWGAALAALHATGADLRIVNLETSVTTSNEAWPKGINYRMHPANVRCLTEAKIDCCGLANNHVLDWGGTGLLETLATLRHAGIRFAGAGHNATEAAAPAALVLPAGGRVLVHAFAAGDSGVPRAWAATAMRPGVALLPNLAASTAARLAASAVAGRQPGDLLLASLHWGGNWGWGVPDRHQAFAHALVDGGFDLVHGHSSHHPKGIEVYRGKLILYGCGDFINDYEGIGGYESFRPDLAVMYLAHLHPAGGELDGLTLVPFQARRFRLYRAQAADAAWLCATLARESAGRGVTIGQRADATLAVEPH
jgi:poly-gamma-glutamate capsule biosynthesis protein CapA/YwtB (metallophosphatase superfamily)